MTERPITPLLPYIVLGLALLACIALLACHPIDNFDTYLHLAPGEWILQHGAIPHHNLFNYTAPGHPWVDHTWLPQVVFALIHRAFAPPGLEVFTALCFAAAFGIILGLWRRLGVGAHLAALPFLVGVLLATGRYAARPELFTNLFLALTLCALFTWRQSNHRAIWALPALVALWVNCHGAVTAGLALLWIFVAGEGIQAAIARRWPAPWLPALPFSRWRTLALMAVAASAALVVNPYGLGWFEAISPARVRFLATVMEEWTPLLKRGPLGGAALGVIFAFMAAGLLSFLFTRRLYLSNLGAAIAFVAAPFISQRNTVLCAFVLLAVMGSNLSARVWPAWLARLAPSPKAARRALAGAGLVVWLVVLAFAWGQPALGWLGMQFRPGFGVADNVIPVRAEQFWRTQRLPGRLFTHMTYSAYVIWKHPQGRPVFVDGLNAFEQPVMDQYLRMFFASRDDALIDRWKINTFILPQPDLAEPDPKPERDLCAFLARSPRWRLVFWDGVSVIFVRDIPRHRDLLERHAYAHLDPTDLQASDYTQHPDAVAAELERALAASPKAPFLHILAGTIYLHLDRVDQAASAFLAAQRLAPHYPDAYTGLGLVAAMLGDLEQAEPMFREAARLAPEDPKPHRGLAAVAQAQGDLRRAVAECKKVVRRSPNTVTDRVALAFAYEQAADPRRATQAWRSVLAMNPDAETAALARERLDALSGR